MILKRSVNIMMKVKPYKGKYCSRSKANLLIDFFETLQTPNRIELEKESNEFRDMILNKRSTVSYSK